MGLKYGFKWISVIYHRIWYGKIKFIKEQEGVHSSSLKKIREEIENIKIDFEKTLQKKNIEHWRNGNFKTYGLPVKMTGIDGINLSILDWFKEKWLKNDYNENREKICFYVWLESNYYGNLIALEKNKKRYFKETYRQFQYRIKSELAYNLWHWIIDIFTLSVGVLCGINVKSILIRIRNNNSLYNVFLMAIAFLVIVGFYQLRLKFQAEYRKKLAKVDMTKETWLRHSKIIYNYQDEILKYLWDLGAYRDFSSQEDQDIHFMERISELWKDNLLCFQHNMKNTEE